MSALSHFDRLFERDDDPWQYRHRWYEQRKRAVTLTALPKRRYQSAYEPGCANGELAAALAPRCERLHASDASAAAVALARQRLAGLGHVTVACETMPHDWHGEAFDLIVISELGYYLDDADLGALIDRCHASLASGGTLLACHWRHPSDDFQRSGEAVHAAFEAQSRLTRLVHHVEADFVMDVWSDDRRSVAQREGIA